LIIRVPNKEDLSGYLKEDYPYQYVHLRNFDKYSLELLFTKIFKLKILEFKDAGFVAITQLLKYKLPIKGYRFVILKLGSLLKRVSEKNYRNFLKIMFEPVEINCVLVKNE